MRFLTLSPRLRAVAELVAQGARFADVGTDHGHLPLWLLHHGVIDFAIATDLRPEPLRRARENFARRGYSDRVSLRLCNGLSGIAPDETDTVAIAGMGGETIAAILGDARWTAEGERRFLLQPMSAADDLRKWLSRSGFAIDQEVLCEDAGRLYLTLVVTPGDSDPLSPAECLAGRQWRGMHAPLRGRLLAQTRLQTQRALEGLERSSRPADAARRQTLEAALDGLIKMEQEWYQWQR